MNSQEIEDFRKFAAAWIKYREDLDLHEPPHLPEPPLGGGWTSQYMVPPPRFLVVVATRTEAEALRRALPKEWRVIAAGDGLAGSVFEKVVLLADFEYPNRLEFYKTKARDGKVIIGKSDGGWF